MRTNEWITDRLPTEADALRRWYVWTMYDNKVTMWYYDEIRKGDPWMPIEKPKPYIKPKRFEVLNDETGWYISEISTGEVATPLLSTREDAKEIAAIFERAVL